MRNLLIAAFIAAFALPARAEEKSDLAPHLKEAQVPLERGIAASKANGTPISAKYEVEDGKLQLSVYTAKEIRSPRSSSITRRGRWPSPSRSPAATTSPRRSRRTMR